MLQDKRMALKVLEQVEDQVFLLLGLALHEGVPEPRRQDKLLLLAVENFPIDEGVADGFGTEKRKEKRKSQWRETKERRIRGGVLTSVHKIIHKQEAHHEDASDDEGKDQRP